MKKQTYGELWDRYVAESFPKLQESDSRLTYPGEEWGNEQSWQRIFDKLFTPSGVANWDAAIEIGGGGGKYTERVLRANDKVRVFGFDVSKNFLDATASRLADHVRADRLTLTEIDPVAPDAMTTLIEQAGLKRKVDAMFSIDAMVHVDLQYLFTYWVNAAQVLKPGGRILMTLADPTTESGLQKITRDIRKFYKFQGRICPKFEYLSEEIVRYTLGQLGFEIESLDAWSYWDGRPARDLYLIAKLVDVPKAESFRDALRQDPKAERPMAEEAETYAALWDRMAGFAIADRPDRARPEAVLFRLAEIAGVSRWQRAVELSLGDTRLTRALLNGNPALKLTAFHMSGGLRAAAAAKFPEELRDGRLELLPFDPVHPDFIYKRFEREKLHGSVDAVISLDTMLHLDSQYQFAWFANAALILKPGGWLVFNAADATNPKGFAKLLSDIRTYFPYQGQACTRFEWQSPSLVKGLLGALGFEIVECSHWDPATGGTDGRDLFVVARLARPEAALPFRLHLSIGLPIPTLPSADAPDTEEELAMPKLTDDEREAAKALGQAYWRQLQIQANPDMTKEQIREQFKTQWGGARREYTKLGHMVIRQLGKMGFAVVKTEKPGKEAEG
jgi:cyclopropane fatty-acyl-phospholipid synthase-like methyltransferase